MKTVVFFAFSSLLLVPAFAFGALNAGVVDGVWFSNPNPEEGEEVRIFTAVQNSSNETIQGTVAFLVNEDIVGTAPFSAQSNEIISVSITHTFTDGDHDVSAYITSVEEDNVAYTIVPDTSVSVAQRAPLETETNAEETAVNTTATSTLETVTETVTETGKDVLTNIEPVTESAAARIEAFRDTLLATTTSTTNATTTTVESHTDTTHDVSKLTATRDFFTTSKTIATTEGIALWKKIVGVLLSILALLLRLWFIPLILILALIFWRMVRGRRIY